MEFAEIIKGMRKKSEIIFLDFNQIPQNIEDYKNIKLFFEECIKKGINPKLPENRQKFNNIFINKSGKKFLIGRYLEDRKEMLKGSKIAEDGRTYHLGIDIFSSDLEDIYSPEDGEIVRTGCEPGSHSYGNYIIIKHITKDKTWYSFLGHLSKDFPKLGKVSKGQKIARLGDWANNENGGWSRHLHYQILTQLPKENETPIGYTSKENLNLNKNLFPDPNTTLLLPNI
ncbi:MAG: peptidoglycan DD-metalloendopeptidase family protein [Nanoarchaeota archaeon]